MEFKYIQLNKTLMCYDGVFDDLFSHIEKIYLTEDLNIYRKIEYSGYIK